MKKSVIALLIALVVVCMASVAFAAVGGVVDKLSDKPCSTLNLERTYVTTPWEAYTHGSAGVDEKGYYFVDDIFLVPHTWKYSPDSTATCVTVGNIHKTCTVGGETVILENVYDPANHADAGSNTPIKFKTAANCTQHDEWYQLCAACKCRWAYYGNIGPHKELIDAENSLHPTCLMTGYKTVVCALEDKGCPGWLDAKGYTVHEYVYALPALTHKADAEVYYLSAPTCTEGGDAVSFCGRAYLIKDLSDVDWNRMTGAEATAKDVANGDAVWCYETQHNALRRADHELSWKVDDYLNWNFEPIYLGCNYNADMVFTVNNPYEVKTWDDKKFEEVATGVYRTIVKQYPMPKLGHNFTGCAIEFQPNPKNEDVCYWTAKSCANEIKIAAAGKLISICEADVYVDGTLAKWVKEDNKHVVLCAEPDAAHATAVEHAWGGWYEVNDIDVTDANLHAGYWLNKCTRSECGFVLDAISYDKPDANPEKVEVAKAQIKSAKSKTAGQLVVTVKDQGADQYQIAYRVKGTDTWKTTTVKAGTSKTIKKLAAGKYQIKVRARVGKTYGPYSSVKTVTVK